MSRLASVNTNELIGALLDYSVAICEGMRTTYSDFVAMQNTAPENQRFNPSSRWEQAGPIIKRERIRLYPDDETDGWIAQINLPSDIPITSTASTPTKAAMRCYVKSILGDTVDFPIEKGD